MIASKNPPHLHGWLVMSKVARSRILPSTPYCFAARKTPGSDSRKANARQYNTSWKMGRSTFPSHLSTVDIGAKHERTEVGGRLQGKKILREFYETRAGNVSAHMPCYRYP